jgi:tetratricopeptide (TPR) repeat protein
MQKNTKGLFFLKHWRWVATVAVGTALLILLLVVVGGSLVATDCFNCRRMVTNLIQIKGGYPATEPLIAKTTRILANENPDVASALISLAELLRTQGEYDVAKTLSYQSLEIRRKVFGEEHLDVAASLGSLAESLKAQGKYDEAEPLYRQSLALRHKVWATHLAASSRDHSCSYWARSIQTWQQHSTT